ncbi:MAG: anti-sigma factor [Labilithrix sp.]
MSSDFRKLEEWEELLADHALVGLSSAEKARLGALIDAEVYAQEAPLFEQAAGEIANVAFVAAQSEGAIDSMPEAVRAKVLTKLRRSSGPTAPRPSRAWARPAAPWLLAAAALLLALASWLWRPPATKPMAPLPVASAPPAAVRRGELLTLAGTMRADFKPTSDPAATQASGDVVWHSGLQQGFMRIHGLSPNDPKELQYQLWIFDDERDAAFPVDGGVFDVQRTESGEIVVPIQAKLNVRRAKLFAITVEKPGGVVVSKRERIVLTASST